ncbi:ABC transporter ATP-binding protein [Acuticoccus mangrovi]|uniref:ABC transporter ATP-binding protein n=1 Tax=Acuticoccus mangrovi TaxID=2796142 RepID=A0A934IKJ8_9HYPH|nr:ABC transporter ATP-binding protein [Acuticoccus mangrovi]MBJ3778203.1 ABC transporter ATP-binding protein [Acuticoccus mangrovi]
MLKVEGLTAAYGRIEVLHDLSLYVEPGEIVAIVGANGAGKTTLMKAIAGIHPVAAGTITVGGEDVTRRPAHERVTRGLALVPEGRQVFGPLSVADNLALGAYRAHGDVSADREEMEALFPILAQRRRQAAGSLSGGQQQMLAIARALMSRPRLLLLDEPSMGLAPIVTREIFEALAGRHRSAGLTVLLVEQNISAALKLASRGYVLETGRVVAEGRSEDLLTDPAIQRAYLGG